MANITIVKTGGLIDVDFGVYGDGDAQAFQARYNSKDIVKVERFSDHVAVVMRGESIWYLVHSALKKYMVIDLVDGSPPANNTDLFNKIKALM